MNRSEHIIGWQLYRLSFFGFVALQWRRFAKIAATAIVPIPYPKNLIKNVLPTQPIKIVFNFIKLFKILLNYIDFMWT